jgi:hypothetical protein
MNEPMIVNTYRNVPISYDPVKKQFSARVGMREIQKPTQSAVEKVILKYQGGGKKFRIMHVDDGWWGMKVEDLEAVGARGSKVLYRRPNRDEVDSLDGDKAFVYDEDLFRQAKALAKEREDLKERIHKLVCKMKKVDIQDLK